MYLTSPQRKFLRAALDNDGIVKRYPTYATTGGIVIGRKNAEALIYDFGLIEPVYEPIATAKGDVSSGYYYRLTPAGRAEAERIVAEST